MHTDHAVGEALLAYLIGYIILHGGLLESL